MKLKFWQKTYILVLALFLAGLFAGILSLTVFSYNKSLSEKEETSRAECSYIASSFERDWSSLTEYGRGADITLLMASYGDHYKKQNVFLCFNSEEGLVYSAFTGDAPAPGDGKLIYRNTDAGKEIVISVSVCGDKYNLVYAKNIEEVIVSFRRLTVLYVSVAAGVSVIVAILLLIILKRLSLPLEKLKRTTELISEGKKGVRADERGHDEFSALAVSFNEMLDKIDGQMAYISKQADEKQMLVDNLAHEIRTPLTTIKGYASYSAASPLDEEERIDALQNIISEAERLSKISEKILDGAYLEHHELTLKAVDLSALLEDTKKRLSYVAEQKQVDIETDLSESTVAGDLELLSILLYNLTENAIKACAKGGKVTLSCKETYAAVEDDGKGMTKEQLSHITEPFYRTDKSRSRAEGGAGLGLTLCRQIVEAHHGKMRFESEPGKGTKISLSFCTPKQD